MRWCVSSQIQYWFIGYLRRSVSLLLCVRGEADSRVPRAETPTPAHPGAGAGCTATGPRPARGGAGRAHTREDTGPARATTDRAGSRIGTLLRALVGYLMVGVW